MPSCAILQCKNSSKWINVSTGGVSYHRFPKDPFVKEEWIKVTGRVNWMPFKSSTICSEHFLEEDFLIAAKGNRYLRTAAVPTVKIVMFYDHLKNVNATSDPTTNQVLEICFCEDCEPVVSQKMDVTRDCLQNQNTDESHSTVKLSGSPSQSKTENGEADASSSTFLSPKKWKLEDKLRWSQEKIKKQSLKIKRLQAQNRKYKKKISNIEEKLKTLEQKFVITEVNIDSISP